MPTITLVTILNDTGAKWWKGKVSGLTRSCGRQKINTTCLTFAIRKKDLDMRLKKLDVCSSNSFNENVMSTVQTMLGLPKRWGRYTKIITYEVDIKNVFRPIRYGGITYIVKPKEIPTQEIGNVNNYVKKLSLISESYIPRRHIAIKANQNLQFPFIGTGETLPYGKIPDKYEKIGPYDVAFKEYVMPGNVKIKNVKYYNSYIDYVETQNLCK